MHSGSRRSLFHFLAVLAVAAVAPSRAEAVCNVSACDAAALIGNAQCCTASTCTIDGTLTVSGPVCTFDFGTRNLTVSHQVVAPGKFVTLKAKSMKLTGLIDVRGPDGANAGDVTIVTTGGTAVAYSQEGGTDAIINASSSAGSGGSVTIMADGMVSFAKGSVVASGGPAGSGGVVDVRTTAGDVSVQIPISASSGPAAAAPNGQILVTAPENLTIGGSGRLVADLGGIDLQIDGAASFAEGALLQASGGGAITLVAGSVSALSEFKADGEGGTVEIRAVTGPLFLQRLSQGITVGPGVQSVFLGTEAAGPDGLLTVDMPILANGAEVEIESTGGLVISKKIETTGILDSEAGDITIDAEDDVHITKAIVGTDIFGEADLSIDGRDVIIEGNLDFRGGSETSGGIVNVTADRDLVLQGDIFVNVSGADLSDAGSVDMQAGRDFTVGPSVEIRADGSPIGAGGGIFLVAGDGFGERLPGNLNFQGDIKANGHVPGGGAFAVLQGCVVSIPAGAVVDVTGDAQSTNLVTARTSLTMAGQLKASAANILQFPTGASLSLPGSFSPAKSAGACTGGTPTADGCQRPVCTGVNVPVGCLYACPTCGDDQTTFPETCDVGASGPFCAGLDLCDARCRLRTCTAPTPCTNPVCDAEAAVCTFSLKSNGTDCDADGNVCNGVGTCSNGSCQLTPGTALQCNDGNPCTGPDSCHPVTGCSNPNLNGPGIAGCDDGEFCTGSELCVAGDCQSGALPCTPPDVCNPISDECETPMACQDPTECIDDGNPCTARTCIANVCGHAPTPGADCTDNPCNGERTCNANGVCQQPTAPVQCNDNNPCTVDTCDPSDGNCDFTQIAGCCTGAGQCGDGNACTLDTCNPNNTCAHTAITCNDNDACTTDACNAQSGCTATPIPDCELCVDPSTCDDDAGPGSECTDKACEGGRCVQKQSSNCCTTNEDCTDIDSNPCTNNGTCVANRCGPVTILDGSPCGVTCNPATCNENAECVPDAPPNCSDNDACTIDVCNNGEGCTHTPIQDCCFAVGDCADQNVCTEEICDLDANLCEYPIPDPTCEPCTGGDPFECGPRCTTGCQAGRCADVTPNCDDNDTCTTDACDAAAGCTHTPRTDLEECQPACTDAECDDDDSCTIDACNLDGSGCTHEPKTSFDALYCRLDAMRAALDAAAADDIGTKLRRRTGTTLGKLRGKVDKARVPGIKCKKARNLVGKIRGPLRKMQVNLNRLVGKQIDAALATTLGTLAGQTANKADEVRAGLGC